MILVAILVGCGGQSSESDPADTVERYLTAKVASDEPTLRGLLCAEMESELAREARSFAGVEGARVENMTCTRDSASDTVTCSGEILATYGTEQQSFPLGSYRVVQEDGEWKWCGEAG
jgi:hypothetical protein